MACHQYPSGAQGKEGVLHSFSEGGRCAEDHPDLRYIGSTADLRKRLATYNAGSVPQKSGPRAFEIYLKSGSEYAFAKRNI